MRIMLKVSIPAEAGNRLVAEGTLGTTLHSILEELKPEAAYFTETNGLRTAYFIVEMKEASQIPAVAEPFFLALNAAVEFHPVMTAQDLAAAGPAIERAAKKYGKK